MAFNDLVAQKIKDFEQQGIPQVFERDLDLGNPQEPKRDNIVYVIVGARRCGKTYRLYQEIRRLQGQGVELDRMLYFNFEDERLRPYEPSLLADILLLEARAPTFSLTRSRKYPNGVRFCDAWSIRRRRPFT